MRRKLYLGLFLVGVTGIVAGDYVFNRLAHAQDAPKKDAPAPTEGGLFEALKKGLEDAVKPPKDLPPPVAVPPVVGDAVIPAPTKKDPPPIGPPSILQPEADTKPVKPIAPPPSVPTVAEPKPIATPPSVPQGSTPKPPIAKPQSIEFPSLQSEPPVVANPPQVDVKPEPPGYPKSAFDTPAPVVRVQDTKPTPSDAALQEKLQSINNSKSSPWSLHVEMITGQTIVTATVNKRHDFKIVCDNLELQTGKGTLKAIGKVRITGDMMTATCERLTISLHEDGLFLEGLALVNINKVAGSARTNAFELKGDKLDLRVSAIQSVKVVQAELQTALNDAAIRTVSHRGEGKQWSRYGTLRPAKIDLGGETAWCLVNDGGKGIVYLVPREGGSLTQYEGRNISVFGAHETINGREVIRVTHIALP